MKKLFLLILIIGIQINYAQIESDKKIIPNKWKALKTSSELGVHGERINLFRQMASFINLVNTKSNNIKKKYRLER